MKANEWPVKSLGEICAIRPPKAEARKRLRPSEEVSFLPMEDLGIDRKHPEPTQRKRLEQVEGSYTYFADGDVLLAKITPCFQNGKLGIARDMTNGVGFGSSEFIVLRPCSELDPEYLYYFLSRDEFRQQGVERMGGSVGQQRVPPEFVLGERIPLPPLPEQRRIVGILDEAFAAIATAKANAEKNLQNAHGVFDSAVDSLFDGLCGEVPGRALGDLVQDVSTGPFGSLLHKSDYEEGGTPLVNPINIQGDVIAPDVRKAVGAATVKRLSRYILHEGDVVTARRGEIGRCAAVTAKQAGWICGTGSFFIRPGSNVDPHFLTHLIRSGPYRTKLEGLSDRATMPSIGNNDLAGLCVHIPGIGRQRELEGRLTALSEQTRRLNDIYGRKLAAFDALKKSLLHQAFSGQLIATESISTLPTSAPLLRFSGLPPDHLHAGAVAMSYKLHEERGNTNEFGHVKAEKVVQMVEAHVGFDLGREPIKMAAGPLDFDTRRYVDRLAKSRKWFSFEQTDSGRYEYEPLENVDFIIEHTKMMLGPKYEQLEALLKWMLPMKWQQAEIVATVYAGWNNLLLEGKTPSDEDIVYESRENWHPEKLKIERGRFFKALDWLRKEGVVPEGKGKRVIAKGK